jgi:hypothetical protein
MSTCRTYLLTGLGRGPRLPHWTGLPQTFFEQAELTGQTTFTRWFILPHREEMVPLRRSWFGITTLPRTDEGL